jgi:hypothetical protein
MMKHRARHSWLRALFLWKSLEENPPNDTLKCSLGNQIEELNNFNTITSYNSLSEEKKEQREY